MLSLPVTVREVAVPAGAQDREKSMREFSGMLGIEACPLCQATLPGTSMILFVRSPQTALAYPTSTPLPSHSSPTLLLT